MFTTRSSLGRLARTALAVLPFAAVACGKDGRSTVQTAEASTVPVTPVTNVEYTPTTPVLVKGVLVDATNDNGEDAFKTGRYRDAAALYKVHVETSPTDAHGFYMLGLASWKAGDFAGAKGAFDKAIELDPTFAKSYFNAGRVLLDLKRAPEALEVIEKGRVIDSTSLDGWRLKARAQSESGDVCAAIDTYKLMLVGDDADAWGLNNLGVLLMNHGQYDEALGPLARAVQVRPTAPLFQNNFGMALERSGFKVLALQHYEEAVRHDSTFTKAVKNADRLRTLVSDSTKADTVTAQGLAEEFRLKVKSWKDVPAPVVAKDPR